MFSGRRSPWTTPTLWDSPSARAMAFTTIPEAKDGSGPRDKRLRSVSPIKSSAARNGAPSGAKLSSTGRKPN